MIKTTSFIVTAFMIGMVYGARAAENSGHYPICSQVAHEVQESWQRGELTRSEAMQVIDSCLAWEDKQ